MNAFALPPVMPAGITIPPWTGSDHFSGLGAWTIAAQMLGLTMLYGLNHWSPAVETFQENLGVMAYKTDITKTEPASVPGSDFLCTSPVCTGYAKANGDKRDGDLHPPLWEEYREQWLRQLRHAQMRALIHQVPRFAAQHQYKLIFFENVTELGQDREFPLLIDAMCGNPKKKIVGLGYKVRQFCLNSAHWGAACSRDRAYLVFAREGIPFPEKDLCPQAYCPRCTATVETWQDWKKQRDGQWKWGDYRFQYCYRCEHCNEEVFPVMRPASDVLDMTLPIVTVKDSRMYSPKQKANIAEGIRRFGGQPFIWTYNKNPVFKTLDQPMPTITTTARLALAIPQGPDVEQCLRRMVEPEELKSAMTIPREHRLHGNKEEQIEMIGNAVTPLLAANIMAHYFRPLCA